MEPIKSQEERKKLNNRLRQRRWRERQRKIKQEKEKLNPTIIPPKEKLFNWCENRLKVPTGILKNKPYKIYPWQRRFLKAALKPDIMEAALSVSRKNGKSGLICALLLAYLKGPLNQKNWRCVVTSMTGALAGELKEQIQQTAEASDLSIEVKGSPPPGYIIGDNGAKVNFLAADKATGHAIGADIALIDEAGLMRENQRGLWNAMLTSISGREGKFICISILGDGPMFKELRQRKAEKGVVWHEYCSELNDDYTDKNVWHKANPGLKNGIKSIKYMESMCARAQQTSSDLSFFRAYDLNAPQNPNKVLLLTYDQWQKCKKEYPERKGWCVIGVDLGGSTSMTAAAAYWPETGLLYVRGAYPGIPDIQIRAQKDGVGTRYERMIENGELKIYPGMRTTPVKHFLKDFLQDLRNEDIRCISADRYRQSEALDIYSELKIPYRLNWRAQSWAEQSDDVRAFQRAAIDGNIKCGNNLLLESAIMESALVFDPNGNSKLDRSEALGRIDAASASIIALGEGMREELRLKGNIGGNYFGIVE